MTGNNVGSAVAPPLTALRTPAEQTGAAADAMAGATGSDDLKRRSIQGGMVTVLSQGLTFVLQTGSMIALARLLSPEDFGLQGMVVAITGLLGLFRDGGLGTASVQLDVLTHEQTSTLFWINVAVGTALMLITAAVAPGLAVFYNEPRLLPVTLVSATAFFFIGLTVQHRALLYRATRFVTMAKIDFLTLLAGVSVAITMALFGLGYWALVGMAVAGPVTTAIAVWIAMPWIPGPPRRGTGIHSMLKFGGKLTLNTLVVYLAYNVDKVLLGRYWGAEPLGLYGRAYQLGNLPVQQLYNAISNIALSALARTQNDLPRLRRSFLKMYGVAVSVTVPVTVMCAVFADEIIGFLLGAKWAGAADVLRLLAPTLLAFALVNPLGWFMYATGRVGRSVSIAILIAAVVPIGVFAGLSRGPEGVALGLSVAMTALVVPIVVWALYKTGITAADYWDSVKRSLFSGLIAGVAGWAVNTATLGTLPPLARLLLGTSVSLSAYGVVLLVFLGQRDVYDDLLSHAFRRRGTVQTKV